MGSIHAQKILMCRKLCRMRLLAAALAGLLVGSSGCHRPDMPIKDSIGEFLRAELVFSPTKSHEPRDIRILVNVKNISRWVIPINLIDWHICPILFDTIGQDRKLVHPPIPAMPKIDDGSYWKDLQAGEQITVSTDASCLFGTFPPPGKYRFRYHMSFLVKLGGKAIVGAVASDWSVLTILKKPAAGKLADDPDR